MRFFRLLIFCCASLAVEGKRVRRVAYPGANKARIDNHPHMVSVQVNKEHQCGGSIISATHVLTAAHCVVESIREYGYEIFTKMKVQVGSHMVGYYGAECPILRIAYRSDFRDGNDALQRGKAIERDMAVITLYYSYTTRWAYISFKYLTIPPGSYLTIAGFGSTSTNAPMSNQLLETTLRTISNRKCNEEYKDTFIVTDDQICAKWKGRYTCEGDSGSPVIYNGDLVGIVSTGPAICESGEPEIYTLVGPYANFIIRAMNIPSRGQYADTYEIDYSDSKKRTKYEVQPPKDLLPLRTTPLPDGISYEENMF